MEKPSMPSKRGHFSQGGRFPSAVVAWTCFTVLRLYMLPSELLVTRSGTYTSKEHLSVPCCLGPFIGCCSGHLWCMVSSHSRRCCMLKKHWKHMRHALVASGFKWHRSLFVDIN